MLSQDFGYEVIDNTATDVSQIQDEEEEETVDPNADPQHIHQIPDVFIRDIMDQRRKDREEQDESMLGQYRGTPERKVPSRTKRKQNRHSKDMGEQVRDGLAVWVIFLAHSFTIQHGLFSLPWTNYCTYLLHPYTLVSYTSILLFKL